MGQGEYLLMRWASGHSCALLRLFPPGPGHHSGRANIMNIVSVVVITCVSVQAGALEKSRRSLSYWMSRPDILDMILLSERKLEEEKLR